MIVDLPDLVMMVGLVVVMVDLEDGGLCGGVGLGDGGLNDGRIGDGGLGGGDGGLGDSVGGLGDGGNLVVMVEIWW